MKLEQHLYEIETLVTLYLTPLYIMHYKGSFNALIMPCNAPYNALYDLVNNCNCNSNTYNIRCSTFKKYNVLKYIKTNLQIL